MSPITKLQQQQQQQPQQQKQEKHLNFHIDSKEERGQRSSHDPIKQLPENTTIRDHNSTTDDDNTVLSRRGRRALKPPLPYLHAFFQALQNPCHETQNPEGYIALCVAENKLILDKLSQRLMKDCSESSVNTATTVIPCHHKDNNSNDDDDGDHDNASASDSEAVPSSHSMFGKKDVYCYNDMRGMMHVRESVARFLSRKFLRPHGNIQCVANNNVADHNKNSVISSEDVILGSGCAGLLNGLFFSLLEAGDAVLIPAPYYAAFESDMKVIAECVPVPVFMANPSAGPTVEELETARNNALEKHNLKVKMLLLTNPNNPLGTIYKAETIENAITWAREVGMHTVVDEIYALSVHDRDGIGNDDNHHHSHHRHSHESSFHSVIEILDNQLGNDVHFLWALSKDFGSSGFRVGVLYTQNKALNDALGNLNIFSAVSQPVQSMLADLLDDEEFIDEFLDHSRKRLKASYEIVTQALRIMEVPYVEAQAGIFVYCDFSSWLPTLSFEGEAILGKLFQDQARIIMTPGESQRDTQPGMFRICYAWVTPQVLEIAMQRLKLVAADIKNFGWDILLPLLATENAPTYYFQA